MKKSVISVLLALIITISCVTMSFALYKGDVDQNGEITAIDARMILRVVAGLDVLDENQKDIADVDNNGDIGATDARRVLRMVAGLDPNINETTEYITFNDIFLENYVKQELGIEGTNKVSKADMAKLTHFRIEEGITDVQDLKYAVNLQSLEIKNGAVNNLESLASIVSLARIEFYCDETYDLSFMKSLVYIEEIHFDMRWCSLSGGAWSDIVSSPKLTTLTLLDPFNTNKDGLSFLSKATSLSDLTLSVEEGTDISALLDIPNLKSFELMVAWSGREATEHEMDICKKLIEKGVTVRIQ